MGKPKIRFKGFTEDWEQRKLGDVFQEYSEKNHPELQALTIIQGGGTVLREESDRNLQYDKLNLSGYKMVCENDFIVHLRSFEGGLEKSNHNGLISPAYHTFHGENVDSRFYYSYFRSYEFIKHKLVPHVYGIRDGRSIDIDGMRTIKIPYTSCDEQKKIGDYIESLDTLITLHQRKCDETKKLKKYMLQKMFPQNGMKVPEIRFEGFTGDWEQRKVKEFIDEGIIEVPMDGNHGEKHPTASEYVNNGIPFLMASDIHNGEVDINYCKYITRERAEKLDKGFAKNGDVLITHKATIGETAILQGLEEEYAVLTPQVTYYRIRDEKQLNRKYLYAFFNSEDFQNDLKKKAAQSTRPYIGISAQQNLMISLPQNRKEQKQIGEYFFSLDHLITLHQRKCDELMKIKKYMLQNMFV